MIKIKSLLREDDLDLSDNPLKITIPQGKYIFLFFQDSSIDFGNYNVAEIELRSGDPKIAAIDTLKKAVQDHFFDDLEYENLDDEEEVKELKREFMRDEYWFGANYYEAGVWEVTGIEHSYGQFHGSKSVFADTLYDIIKKEDNGGSKIILSGNRILPYLGDLSDTVDIDSEYSALQKIRIRKGGFGEFIEYVVRGGDPRTFDVNKILTNG